MRPVAVLTAISQEFEAIAALCRISATTDVGGATFAAAELGGREIVLAQCGIGKVNAAFAATVLLDRFACFGVVFSGVAGSLNPDLHVGDVLVARRLVQHDYGTMASGEFWPAEPGEIPYATPKARHEGYALTPDLETRLAEAVKGVTLAGVGGRAARLRFGAVLTGDTFLTCGRTRGELQALHMGDAVEMEGAAVAQVAARFGVPCVVVRTISDEASDGSHLDFNQFAALAAANSAALAPAVVRVLGESEGWSSDERPGR